MKVLLVHNFYGSAAPSGENAVFELERQMLLDNGIDVCCFTRHSDDIRAKGMFGKIVGAAATPWNPFAVGAFRKILHEYRPDVVHAHNTFPLISPAIFPASKGVARVLTLHNYRLQCPAAIPMRDSKPCISCIESRTVTPALTHACYRGSRLATLPIAAKIALNNVRGTWRHDIERFIALSEFQKELMIKGGLPAKKVTVKPNFYPGVPSRIPFDSRPQRVVFAGRGGEEKGVQDLVAAWRMWGADAPMLHIVGDGPLLETLRSESASLTNIRFLGQMTAQEAERQIANARLLVVPSRWFEGFPMVVREALAFGVPVAVANLGPLPTIVSPAGGLTFKPADPKDLLSQVRKLWSEPEVLRNASDLAECEFENNYTQNRNFVQLMDIYAAARAEIT